MNPKICPNCDRPIPPQAPGGFCPACVLRDADEPPPPGRAAPSLAEVAAAFPQFEILSFIGQGGMGTVFKARQPGLDRVVALKILCPELGRDPAFAERFAREARVLAKLNHPNIVTVFEHGESGGFFYLLMEYVDGVNLRQAMRAGRFTPEQALAVVPGICDALQAAHAEGVWHRDIKPENILLDAQGTVKIVDFGIARLVGDPARDFTLTRTGAALGSAAYMAPEQHEKPHEVDHRADIYSLGVVIYEMLTGELPLGRFPAPSRRAAVSARIDEIVFQTLEKERELRQQSAAEVKTDVHRARLADEGGPRLPGADDSKPAQVSRWLAGSLALVTGGAVLAVAGLYIIVKFRYLGGGPGGALALALGCVTMAFGLMGGLWASYLSIPDWRRTAGIGVLVALSLFSLGVGGAAGHWGPLGVIVLGLGVWAYLTKRKAAVASGVVEDRAGNWLPFALLAVALTLCVLLGGLALMTGFDFPSEKGWVVGMGGLVFVATAAALYLPLRFFRARWAGFFTRFKRLHWGLAAVAILAAALVAKRLDGNWPNANYLEVVSGRVEGKPPSLELLPLLHQAAGDRAASYQISVTGDAVGDLKQIAPAGNDFRITTLASHPGHAAACAERLNQLLPAAVGIHWELNNSQRDHYVWVRDNNTSRALVWGVASLAAILTALLGGRRTGWLVVEGVVLHGWLMLMPVWPMHGSPKLVTDPPLKAFAAEDLPETVDLIMPELAVATLFDAVKRGQTHIVRRCLSKDLVAAIDKGNRWQEVMDRYRVNDAWVRDVGLDRKWNLTTVRVEHDGYEETLFMAQEADGWKVDSVELNGGRVGPFSLGVPKASPPPAAAPPEPPAPPVPTAEEVFRKMVAAANAWDGEEFVKYEYRPSIPLGNPPTVASRMAPFFGEILLVKQLPPGRFDSKDDVRLVTKMKGKDGDIVYRGLQFTTQDGQRRFQIGRLPNYRASCRVEFRPDQFKAESLLKLHLGETPFTAVPGADGQFDIGGEDISAAEAVRRADHSADRLLESLKRAGQDSSFKIIQRAKTPEAPWLGEEAPTAEKPSP